MNRRKRQLKFSKEEELVIRQNGMLTDESINIAQNLLSAKFPQYEGFQDTVLGKVNQFDVIHPNAQYIQILNSASNLHWVCVANTNQNKSSNEEHYLYDSYAKLSEKYIPSDITSQIASYSCHPDPELVLHVTSVQQQNNSVDCGLYAIAFATSLCYGHDPESIVFDHSLMRSHLIKCIQDGDMTPFPSIGGKRCKRCPRVASVVQIYCTCRQPYYPQEDFMVCCKDCNKWYHKKCAHVPIEFFRNKKKECLCLICKNLSSSISC